MTDKRALKILFYKYWDSSIGWQNRDINAEDFQYAKDKGLMFDEPLCLSHDEIVERCVASIEQSRKDEIVSAFVSSLSTRNLAHRSALSSYAFNWCFSSHQAQQKSKDQPWKMCCYCGEFLARKEIDLNVLSFERFKFGGVRHTQPAYAMFDLERFFTEPKPAVDKAGVEILWAVIDAFRDPAIKNKTQASNSLKKVIKGNNDERDGLLAALGYCGILNLPEYPNLHKNYTPLSERDSSNYSKSDWPFPTDLWQPNLGMNKDAIDFWFSDYS